MRSAISPLSNISKFAGILNNKDSLILCKYHKKFQLKLYLSFFLHKKIDSIEYDFEIE